MLLFFEDILYYIYFLYDSKLVDFIIFYQVLLNRARLFAGSIWPLISGESMFSRCGDNDDEDEASSITLFDDEDSICGGLVSIIGAVLLLIFASSIDGDFVVDDSGLSSFSSFSSFSSSCSSTFSVFDSIDCWFLFFSSFSSSSPTSSFSSSSSESYS